MLTTVFSKSLLDRWRGAAITVVSLSVLLLFAMAAYRDLDISIYTDLPASLQSLIGIPEDADVASLAYSAIYNSYGAMAWAVWRSPWVPATSPARSVREPSGCFSATRRAAPASWYRRRPRCC